MQDQEQMLDETVKQFLSEGRLFTGYDVTKETRDREKIQMRHKDVRGSIHELESLSDAVDFGYEEDSGSVVQWRRSTVNHPQSGQSVFVYHPDGKSASNYNFGGSVGSISAPTMSNPAATCTMGQSAATSVPLTNSGSNDFVSDSGGKNDDGTFSTDYRKRLLVRSEYVKGLGLDAGDMVYIVADPSKNTITLSATQPTLVSSESVLVDRKGYLYLSSRILKSAGLVPEDSFEISAEAKSVDISQQ